MHSRAITGSYVVGCSCFRCLHSRIFACSKLGTSLFCIIQLIIEQTDEYEFPDHPVELEGQGSVYYVLVVVCDSVRFYTNFICSIQSVLIVRCAQDVVKSPGVNLGTACSRVCVFLVYLVMYINENGSDTRGVCDKLIYKWKHDFRY